MTLPTRGESLQQDVRVLVEEQEVGNPKVRLLAKDVLSQDPADDSVAGVYAI